MTTHPRRHSIDPWTMLTSVTLVGTLTSAALAALYAGLTLA